MCRPQLAGHAETWGTQGEPSPRKAWQLRAELVNPKLFGHFDELDDYEMQLGVRTLPWMNKHARCPSALAVVMTSVVAPIPVGFPSWAAAFLEFLLWGPFVLRDRTQFCPLGRRSNTSTKFLIQEEWGNFSPAPRSGWDVLTSLASGHLCVLGLWELHPRIYICADIRIGVKAWTFEWKECGFNIHLHPY